MDDMKKLVERYKQELMEYSKASKTEPKARLEFPEMTAEKPVALDTEPAIERRSEAGIEEPAEKTDNNDADTARDFTEPEEKEEARKPQIIGYGGDDIMSQFNDIFGGQSAEDEYAEISDEAVSDGVSTVTPQQAEELDDIPESGESFDEQLGRRDFELQTETINSTEDIQPLVQEGDSPLPFPEREYASLDEFMEVNSRRGTARFRTYTARGALPVVGASIIISNQIGGQKHVYYVLTTDESGQTPIVTLPAPPKELSETPDSDIAPYSVYDAEVTAQGYNTVLINRMPVFEGVQSLQRVAMVPDLGQMSEIINESEPDLNGGK